MVFCDVTSHHFVRGCQRLEGICSLHLQGRKYLQAEVFTEIFVLRYPTADCHTPKIFVPRYPIAECHTTKYFKFCTFRYESLKYNQRRGV